MPEIVLRHPRQANTEWAKRLTEFFLEQLGNQ